MEELAEVEGHTEAILSEVRGPLKEQETEVQQLTETVNSLKRSWTLQKDRRLGMQVRVESQAQADRARAMRAEIDEQHARIEVLREELNQCLVEMPLDVEAHSSATSEEAAMQRELQFLLEEFGRVDIELRTIRRIPPIR
jgi:uncharacterized protein (DUF342 family)